MCECASRLTDWLTVTGQTTWGSADPFDLVDGGKEGLSKVLCDVTSDVKEFPADGAAYGSYLVGRLMAYADVSEASIAHLAVFVEMDKSPAHVKMWKAGLEAGRRHALASPRKGNPRRKRCGGEVLRDLAT